jgi:hypothetical protein
LAQGKKVWLPAAAAVTVTGAVAVHPASPAAGGVADWVIMYPVTATLSVAVNALTLTDRLAAEAGMVNAPTIGAVVSGMEAVTAMFTIAGVTTAETLPAASLAQGKKVWLPAAAAVTVAGALSNHPAAVAAGDVADWVTMYPVTATSSVAMNALTLTDRLAAEGGMVNAVTAGAVVSGGEAVAAMFTIAGVPTAETLPAPSLAQQ